MREQKQILTAEVKMTDDGHGSIEGYANVKGVVDSYNDRVVDGAYKNLDKLVADGFVAQGHEWSDMGIGMFTEAREDDHGLYVKINFHSDEKSQRVRTICKERLAAGKSVSFSIGYFTNKYSFVTEDEKQIRLLEAIDVFEVSVVTVPANSLSTATGVKKAGSGSPFAEHIGSVMADVDGLAERCEEIKQLRAEKGKQLSTERKAELEELRTKVAATLTVIDGALTDEKSDGHDAPNEDNSMVFLMPVF